MLTQVVLPIGFQRVVIQISILLVKNMPRLKTFTISWIFKKRQKLSKQINIVFRFAILSNGFYQPFVSSSRGRPWGPTSRSSKRRSSRPSPSCPVRWRLRTTTSTTAQPWCPKIILTSYLIFGSFLSMWQEVVQILASNSTQLQVTGCPTIFHAVLATQVINTDSGDLNNTQV